MLFGRRNALPQKNYCLLQEWCLLSNNLFQFQMLGQQQQKHAISLLNMPPLFEKGKTKTKKKTTNMLLDTRQQSLKYALKRNVTLHLA